MRLLFFVLTLFTSAVVASAQTVGGTVALKGQQMFLKTDDPCNNYLVASNNETALNALIKLAPGDVITATGKKNPAHCTVAIESVEYVGLRRLLGNWYSSEAVINVQDFNSMKFYAAQKISENGNTVYKYISQTPIEYSYSLIPSAGNEWVMFLSDSKSTTFGTIQFHRGSAVLKIYRSDTGALNKTLILYRMTTGKN
ncbi:hypothetical protein ACLVWU_10485 [Bdellovibrio sp. HCB290]|uniref:hypothetical protein n=1 Tax=Bdellovibrio sp. HCB290 TaxID=3394356 RepID=UPI0039B58777